jgi:integrase
METEIREGVGKQSYKDYVQARNKWLMPYFGTTDIAKLDLAAVTAFDAWRTQQSGKVPAQSTINNHNSALNRVLDEAELNGWIVKSLRPTLLNKGVKTQSRGSFSVHVTVSVTWQSVWMARQTSALLLPETVL